MIIQNELSHTCTGVNGNSPFYPGVNIHICAWSLQNINFLARINIKVLIVTLRYVISDWNSNIVICWDPIIFAVITSLNCNLINLSTFIIFVVNCRYIPLIKHFYGHMHMPVCIIFLMKLKHGLYLMRFHRLLSNQYQHHIYIIVLEFMSHTMSLVSRSANLYFLYFHPSTSGIVDMKLRWWMTET